MLFTTYITKAEFDAYDTASKKDQPNIFHVITDKKGKKYLVCHGDKYMKMLYNNYSYYTPDEVYEKAIRKGLIKDGEKINICCCYGGLMSKPTNKNITILNTEKIPLFIERHKTNNGDAKLVMFTKNNLLTRFCAAVAMF